MPSSAEEGSGSLVVVRPSLRSLSEEIPGRHAQERWLCGVETSKGGHWPSSRVSSGTVQQPPGWLWHGSRVNHGSATSCLTEAWRGAAAGPWTGASSRSEPSPGSFAKDGRGQRCSVNDWSGSPVQLWEGEDCGSTRSVGEAVEALFDERVFASDSLLFAPRVVQRGRWPERPGHAVLGQRCLAARCSGAAGHGMLLLGSRVGSCVGLHSSGLPCRAEAAVSWRGERRKFPSRSAMADVSRRCAPRRP